MREYVTCLFALPLVIDEDDCYDSCYDDVDVVYAVPRPMEIVGLQSHSQSGFSESRFVFA